MHEILRPFVLRRLKREVLGDKLPPKVNYHLWCYVVGLWTSQWLAVQLAFLSLGFFHTLSTMLVLAACFGIGNVVWTLEALARSTVHTAMLRAVSCVCSCQLQQLLCVAFSIVDKLCTIIWYLILSGGY
jgi:hypothetical protein